MKNRVCGYCGGRFDLGDGEHVFPKCLYPKSKHGSRVQRLTVPACKRCNKSFQDDEVHFRNVMTVAGEPNRSVYENWQTVVRSFKKPDGARRIADLREQLVSVQTNDGARHAIYPANDPRVMRVIRKIVRGLCFHHRMLIPVPGTHIPEDHVWVDVQRFQIPPAFLDPMTREHREADIAQYRYTKLDDDDIDSAWLLLFFERTPFIATVSKSPVPKAGSPKRSRSLPPP